MEARARAAKRESDAMLSQAWHTEAFARMSGRDFKGALEKYLGRKARRKAQTPEEMLAVLMQAQAGGAPLDIREIN